jgi:hypothetical protein
MVKGGRGKRKLAGGGVNEKKNQYWKTMNEWIFMHAEQ